MAGPNVSPSNLAPESLPTGRAAERLLRRKDTILQRFVERVRECVPAARTLSWPIAVNTFPVMIDALADALVPTHPRKSLTDGTSLGSEHGGERARLTTFRTDDLIREYHCLRDTIFEELTAEGTLTAEEHGILMRSLDTAMLESCTAYELVSQRFREQVTLALTHDLRGPLSAASASAGLILRRPDAPDVARWAARVADSIDRADKMIRDILDASRVGSGGRLQLDLEPCDLVTVVDDVVTQLRTIHGDRFVVRGPEQVMGFWSAESLRRAVENLCTNAVKYGDAHRPITVSLCEANARAIVEVHNSGSYVPLEERELLFQAFRRSRAAEKSGKQGWGIGLALVRGVAEAHGGSITVDSLPEQGTTFAINVPLDARPFQEAPMLE